MQHLSQTNRRAAGLPAILAMRERMRRSEVGRQILAERPLITVSLGLHDCQCLLFGDALWDWLLRWGLTFGGAPAAMLSLCPLRRLPPYCCRPVAAGLRPVTYARRLPLLCLAVDPPVLASPVQDDVVSPCWDMPEHTFGGAYARFMGSRGFLASGRPPCRCVWRGWRVNFAPLAGVLDGEWVGGVRPAPEQAGWAVVHGFAVLRGNGLAVSRRLNIFPGCVHGPPSRFIDDPELAYVITRARQVGAPQRCCVQQGWKGGLGRQPWLCAACGKAWKGGLGRQPWPPLHAAQSCRHVYSAHMQSPAVAVAALPLKTPQNRHFPPCVRPLPQVHDFWHVLFGCHTNGFGEVALKAVEFVQVGGWVHPRVSFCFVSAWGRCG